MKLHSWPYPVLACQALCEEQERDYLAQCDFRITLVKHKVGHLAGKFKLSANVGSSELCNALKSGLISLVLFEEALESPMRRARKLDVTNDNDGNFFATLEIDSSKFSGGLQVCAYLVAIKDFKLSTKECVPGYPKEISICEGSFLGYSNAKRIEEEPIDFADLFEVRGDPNVEGMSVDFDTSECITISLSPGSFLDYKTYRGIDGKGRAASIVGAAILVPALIDILANMINQFSKEDEWPVGIPGARGILARQLDKEDISPAELEQKGAANIASLLVSRLPFNIEKLFKDLDEIYKED